MKSKVTIDDSAITRKNNENTILACIDHNLHVLNSKFTRYGHYIIWEKNLGLSTVFVADLGYDCVSWDVRCPDKEFESIVKLAELVSSALNTDINITRKGDVYGVWAAYGNYES